MKNTLPALLTLSLVSTPLFADENQPLLDKTKFSVGAGISSNSVSGPVDDEIGYQFFAAYDLDKVNLMEHVNSSVEFGYMDYGFSSGNSGGLWVNYVIDNAITGPWGWLARLGLDLGDDDGVMFGGGVDYDLNDKMSIRGEYVVRDNIDSIQLNFKYHL
ncbi:MAG: hypothetical protein OQL06_07150 [Gammaproteobacteria bacterium]|nr:hypothetical protein [Gammaproteobacteria bacterium]